MQNNTNLSLETTRKKALERMQRGMVAYKLASLGWDVSEHYGDGFDLLCLRDGKKKIARIELKAIDLKPYLKETKGKRTKSKETKSFSQAISPNEISAATHLIISIFDGIELKGHYVMSVQQAFDNVKSKGTSKFKKYKNFSQFLKAVKKIAQKKIECKKGNKGKLPRLHLDIGCAFGKFNKGNWMLEKFKNNWDNL